MSQHILTQQEDGVLEIIINRPEARNALTQDMYESMHEHLLAAAQDRTVRVVLFRGEGNTYCAGNDMMGFMSIPETIEETGTFKFLRTLFDFPKVIVAAVEGYAIGVGATMLLHFDLVYAASGAKFQYPFVNLGVVPEAGSSMILTRIMGYHKAAELLMLGDKFTAERAERLGLINEVVEPSEVLSHARAVAKRLSKKPPGALRETKRLMNVAHREELEKLVYLEGEALMERVRQPELAEAVSAFFQKREPDFSSFE